MPNRLKSAFSGSAWTFDEASGQYYLHLFSKTTRFKLGKPTNASVGLRDDEFWIDKGIGGFRLDVIDLVGKIPGEEITNVSFTSLFTRNERRDIWRQRAVNCR